MRLAYDAQADALSLVLEDVQIERSCEPAPGLIVNLDRDGNVVALEILQARRRIGGGLRRLAIDLQDLVAEL